jgi:hypothetical protein
MITAPDGTVSHKPPAGPVVPGTVMAIDSLDFRGTSKKHDKRAFGSDYLRCTFDSDPQNPDCFATSRSTARCCASTGSTSSGAPGATSAPPARRCRTRTSTSS